MNEADSTVDRMTAAQRAAHWEGEARRWRAAYLAVLAGVEAAQAIARDNPAD